MTVTQLTKLGKQLQKDNNNRFKAEIRTNNSRGEGLGIKKLRKLQRKKMELKNMHSFKKFFYATFVFANLIPAGNGSIANSFILSQKCRLLTNLQI